MKPGIRIINTARGELIDEAALKRAIDSGAVAGAGLDVFEKEPPLDWSLAQLPQVVATPHIAASTEEAQELVGLETAAAVRDFLRDGMVRNAVNFPSIHPEELQRLQPVDSAVRKPRRDRVADGPGPHRRASPSAITARWPTARGRGVLASSAAAGVLRPILSSGVSIVNARAAARGRGIDIVESRSSPAALHEPASRSSCTRATASAGPKARCSSPTARGWSRSAASTSKPRLAGRCLIICNDDQPGVIGEVGTILGRHGINIANFALGLRNETGAVGVVNVDEEAGAPGAPARRRWRIRRKVSAIREAWVVRLTQGTTLRSSPTELRPH